MPATAKSPEPEEIDAGARKSAFMRYFTYGKAILKSRQQLAKEDGECWQKAKGEHVHVAAAKTVLRLAEMDAQKRAAWLRSFDAYRRWARLDAQIEMFPEPPAPQVAVETTVVTVSETTAIPPGGLDISTSVPVPEIGPETPEDPPEDGRQACRLGVDATLNPYDPEKAPEEYESWGDAWTAAYGAGEWQADLEVSRETTDED